VLNLQPVKREAEAAYSGAIWGASPSNTSSWGGNVVSGINNSFELYMSEMIGNCGLVSWQTNSRIVHVTSEHLTGPYSKSGTVMNPFAHNANPIVLSQQPHQGHYAVFHVGSGTDKDGPRKDCHNGTTPARAPFGLKNAPYPSRGRHTQCKPTSNASIPLSKTLQVPHAATPAGPWELDPQTCVGPGVGLDSSTAGSVGGCPHFSNAAPLILANGTTLLVHSGCPGAQGSGFNLAVAPNWAGPYRPTKGVDKRGVNAWYTPSIQTLSPSHPGAVPIRLLVPVFLYVLYVLSVYLICLIC
jgi:hypothetical protein